MAEECARVVEEEEAFSDLYLTGVEFAGEGNARELGRGSYGVVYEVMWRGTPCAAKKIHPLLLQAVPGEWDHRNTSGSSHLDSLCCYNT